MGRATRWHRSVNLGVLGLLALVASCLLPPPASQSPEPCDFKGCGAGEIRICQDQCVVPRQLGEPCDPYVFCDPDYGEIDVCAAGLTCDQYFDLDHPAKFNFQCVQTKPAGGDCYVDPRPICPATDPCPSGQYCRPKYSSGGHGGYGAHDDPRTIYHERPEDPRTVVVFANRGQCVDLPKQGEPCGRGGCNECEPGLECIEDVCRRACLHADDCPCESGERLCCGGYCRAVGSTWLALRSAIFDNYNCAKCHSGPDPDGNLNLETLKAYGNLVNVPADGDSAWLRIKPGSPDDSVLYRLLAAKTLNAPLPSSWKNGMPLGTMAAVPADVVESLRLWILAGANENGLVPGTENVSGGCAPLTPTPTLTATPMTPIPTPTWTPLCSPAPAPGTGVRLYAPPWQLGSDSEREICFATYFDFDNDPVPPPTDVRKVCPTPVGLPSTPSTCVRFDEAHFRQTMNYSHHSIIYSYSGSAGVTDPSWGTWSCLGGSNAGQACNPLTTPSPCGDRGACVAAHWECGNGTPCNPTVPGTAAPAGADCGAAAPCAIRPSPGCVGYGPSDFHVRQTIIGGSQGPTADDVLPDKVYGLMPLKGIIVWNSHARNIDHTPVHIEQCYDLDFAGVDDIYQLRGILDFAGTFALGIPPYQSREYCRFYTFPRNSHVVKLDGHMHKRGQEFRIWGPPNTPCAADGGCPATPPPTATPMPTPIYDNLKYDAPTPVVPGYCLDSTAAAERTILYCANYYNGPTAQAEVKRNSTAPNPCTPMSCAAGPIGMNCSNDAGCMSIPGACDACLLTGGFTTDDEMFILLGGYYEAPCP